MEGKGYAAEQDSSPLLDTQILALRMLSAALGHSPPTANTQTMVQERLFKLIGYSTLMCRFVTLTRYNRNQKKHDFSVNPLFFRTDGSHYGDQGLLQKVRKGRGKFEFMKDF